MKIDDGLFGDGQSLSSSPVARVRGALVGTAATAALTGGCSVPTATSFAPFDSSRSFFTMSNSFKSSFLNSIRVGFRRFIVWWEDKCQLDANMC